MPFYHGVMVCHIIFRGAMKRTFYTVLSVRKRCSLLHRKDMRQSVPVFASPMVEIREILCVWKRKVIRQTTRGINVYISCTAYTRIPTIPHEERVPVLPLQSGNGLHRQQPALIGVPAGDCAAHRASPAAGLKGPPGVGRWQLEAHGGQRL